jgi:hypothetical protein
MHVCAHGKDRHLYAFQSICLVSPWVEMGQSAYLLEGRYVNDESYYA